MKKTSIGLFLMLLPLIGFSQSIFDKFEESERIGSMTISKGMLHIVADMMEEKGDKESEEFVEIAKSIDGIKIFVSEDEGAAADMAATMKQYVKSSKLEELMKIKDGDTNLKFYVKSGKDEDHVSELLMFVTGLEDEKEESYGIETVLLTMSGDIDLTKVGSLTRKMNLPKELDKVEKQ
ncbi:DUF4252 domain-containing protein [Flagellimonas allohymeniacidonis]|uniref:DUF4252 domain-containing protein n=1 Tax=Flagellimonas allohymeniacidonis TaxID=2517819 RepID=A0A4V2HSU7_9FLAO|nr:DUF4252 domain-containing protein [Allomuricauda hymeniacidonis]TAI49140.1 DUF4252 domain-containing protein [Allomuricauda hymeniacidonis]